MKPVKRAPKKKAEAPTVSAPAKTLVLRTCAADMTSHKGTFTWPRQGPVECTDWDPNPECGNGLHGLPWGNGDWTLLSSADDAVWQVVEVETSALVSIDNNKAKFQRGTVLFSGSRVDAVIRVLCGSEAMSNTMLAAQAWDEKAGNSSTAASSGYSSTAASSGDSSTAASSGYSSTAASSGDSSKAASSGDYSTAASSGNSSTAASSGDSSTADCDGASGIAASIGLAGQAKAGANGLLILTHWVESEKRYRACVGNVGEDGIKADTWYRVDGGKLVEA
jgi:hypothetical protein